MPGADLTVAKLLGKLAAEGAHFALEGGRLVYCGPRRLLTPHLRAAVDAKRADIVAFLRRTEDEMTDEELAEMGYRRRSPGARILADAAEFEGGWSPPEDWGTASTAPRPSEPPVRHTRRSARDLPPTPLFDYEEEERKAIPEEGDEGEEGPR